MPPTAVDIFESYRRTLIGLVYRITGSMSDAEDITQDTFLKWNQVDPQTIQSPYAWLAKVATRLALDHLKSARVQRVSYPGPWLPEPFITDSETPDQRYALDQSITMALLVLLEQLSPDERAAFILHDLLQFTFPEVANILRKTDTACRKMASRARAKMGEGSRQPKPGNREEHEQVITAFFSAVKQGDVSALLSIFSENISLHADGGGKAMAAQNILQGRDAVTNFVLERLCPALPAVGSAAIQSTWFNGAPGMVIWDAAEPVSAFNFAIDNGKIYTIHALRNPDKLRFFKRVGPGPAGRL